MRLLLLLFLLWVPAAWATTTTSKEVTCPVCATVFKVLLMMSTNNAGGQDRDFCSHAGGDQPVVLSIAACPHCHYAEWAEKLADKPHLVSDEVKAAVAKQTLPAGAPTTGPLPAWVAYDLKAQLARPSERGNLYIRAAWSVRFECNPFERELERIPQARLDKFSSSPGKDENRADESLRLARKLLKKPLDGDSAVLVAYLLRNHGEFHELLRAMPLLKPHLKASDEELQASIERERFYLAKAEQALREEKPTTANFVYLVGELNRRLGRRAEAEDWYKRAAALKTPDAILKQWIREQPLLLKL